MRSLPLFLGSLVFLVMQCLPLQAADVDPAQYFGLTTGDDWAMDVVITLPNGKELKAIARRRTEDEVVRNGTTYFRTRTWMEGLPSRSESTRLFRKDAQGAYSVSEEDKNAKEQVEMLFPVKVGSTWSTEDRGIALKVTILGIENFTIGEKTYENCIRVRTESAEGRREDYWEAPKIGTVRSEAVLPNGMKFVLTLKEFKSAK